MREAIVPRAPLLLGSDTGVGEDQVQMTISIQVRDPAPHRSLCRQSGPRPFLKTLSCAAED